MLISGFQIDGDPDGLTFLRANKEAVIGLVNLARSQGTAAFMYKQHRYVVFPSPNGAFMVARSDGGRGASRKADGMSTKKYL